MRSHFFAGHFSRSRRDLVKISGVGLCADLWSVESLAQEQLPRQVEANGADWIEQRIRTGHGRVDLPPGDFIITRPLNVSGVTIIGSGSERTRLIYVGPADLPCLQAVCNDGSGLEIRHLALIRGGLGGGTAVKTDLDANCYFNVQRRLVIENVVFKGSGIARGRQGWTSPISWGVCVDIGDSWGAYIDKVDAIGGYDIKLSPEQADNSTFLRCSALGGILSLRVSSVSVMGFRCGVQIGPKVFFFIHNSDFAACLDGIVSIHGDSDGFSEGRIRDCFVNAQRVGVYLRKTAWRLMDGVTVNRHKEGWPHGDWVGLRLEGVFKSWISSMRFQVDERNGPFLGNNTGMVLENCSDLVISKIMFGAGLSCDVQQIGSRRIKIIDNINLSKSSCRA